MVGDILLEFFSPIIPLANVWEISNNLTFNVPSIHSIKQDRRSKARLVLISVGFISPHPKGMKGIVLPRLYFVCVCVCVWRFSDSAIGRPSQSKSPIDPSHEFWFLIPIRLFFFCIPRRRVSVAPSLCLISIGSARLSISPAIIDESTGLPQKPCFPISGLRITAAAVLNCDVQWPSSLILSSCFTPPPPPTPPLPPSSPPPPTPPVLPSRRHLFISFIFFFLSRLIVFRRPQRKTPRDKTQMCHQTRSQNEEITRLARITIFFLTLTLMTRQISEK